MNDEGKEAKRFCAKFFNFLMPFILYFIFGMWVLIMAGEFVSSNKVIHLQTHSGKQVLFGRAYFDKGEYFKLQSTVYRKPKILVLGTSRVTQFRSNFLRDNDIFYNAGRGVSQIEHYNYFLTKIPKGQEPNIIIVGLDQYFFCQGWTKSKERVEYFYSIRFNPLDTLQEVVSAVNHMYGDFVLKRKFSIPSLFSHDNRIGLAAIVYNNGLRNDGSVSYAKEISEIADSKLNGDFQFRQSLSYIEAGIGRFPHGIDILPQALHELQLFLKQCEERNIYVIGFLPPYAHVVYKKMASVRDSFGYLFNLGSTLGYIFNKYKFDFYDFSDLQSVGATDTEALDGLHVLEKATLRLFIILSENNEKLRTYVDIPYLKRRLKETDSEYHVFNNDEF